MSKKFLLSLLLVLAGPALSAQVENGLYPYGSFDSLGVDSIDRGSLNVHFSIPVVTKQGRGLPFQYELVYDSLVWTPVGSVGSQVWTPATGWGLHGQLNEGFEGYLSNVSNTTKCYQTDGSFYWATIYRSYVYHDAFGVSHPFSYVNNTCTGNETGGGPSPDGSGYSFSGGDVTSADGKQITAPVNNQMSAGSITDANGNYISNHGNGTFTDTLGKTALTISGSGTASSPRVFTYSTPTGTANVTVTYKTYAVQTNFTCSVTQYNLSQDLVDRITLADGTFYQLGYETTPGNSSSVTGRLASLTVPQGGVITYQYTGVNNGIVCADGTPQGLTRKITNSTRTYTRSSITANTSHTDILDGLSNDLGFDFVMSGTPEAFYETNRTIRQGSSTVLLSRQTCYNTSTNPCTTTAITPPISQIDTYETLNGIQQRGSTLTYNSYGLQTAQTDYDFGGASSRGSVLRKETWIYPSSGIVNLVSTDSVVDGSGNSIGYTIYSYDETTGPGHAALVATSGLPQHNAVNGQRGNLTTMNPSSGTGGSVWIASAYEDTGNPVSVTTPSGGPAYVGATTFAYDSATHAFPTTRTPPTPSSGVSLASSATYDPNSGLPLTTVDPNNQTVTYKTYDALLRPTEIDYPDGGSMIAGYTANQTGAGLYMKAGIHTNTQTNYGSYGKVNWVAVQNGSGGYYWNNYCYDGNDNIQYAAYRFASGAPIVCSGAGDSYTYDALGRVLTINRGDSTTVTFSYKGRATQVTDENGVSRVVQVDGLGRPTAVCEISGSTLHGVAPSNCALDITTASGFKTAYAYSTDVSKGNALKVAVTQGQQTRTFETDWLGRTTLVTQPESGTTTYSYAYSTSAGYGLTVTRIRPQANQTGTAQTTTTTQYDSVGRAVSVGYNDNLTPTRGFSYDVDIYWPQTSTNLKGRLAATGGGSGSTWNGSAWSYDVMGRVVNLWQCGPASCGTSYQAARPLSFSYDWAGNLTQESDNYSGTITYGRSIAGEVTSITNQTYTNLPQNPPNLVSNVVNGPDGPVSYTLGNRLNVYLGYDTLGRLSGRWVCSGPATMNCSGGAQAYGTSGSWRGARMVSQSDSILNQQVTFGYDEFNRLTSRTVTQGTQQNYTYGYDLYGNRISQTALQGGYNFNPAIDPTTNRITTSGYSYDAAGNMTNDTVHSYKYDAEGNIIAVDNGSTAQYAYDVFNHRIHVQTSAGTTEYIYDYAGRRVSSWVSPNNQANEGRIYWDGQLVAHRSLEALTYFDHEDTPGTQRIRTNYAGWTASSYVSLPWGDGYTATVNNGGGDQDNLHFAGLERDAESGTEHAQFRNYASAQGRWLAPDPYLGSYDLTNPQSMNRYAYALNNPTSLIDPSGWDYGYDCGDNCVGVVGTPDPNPNPCGWDPSFCGGGWVCQEYGCGATGGGNSGGGSGGSGPAYGPPHLATLSAPNKGITKAQTACVADVAINYGLGFIPGYNAAKLAFTVAGGSVNFVQNYLSGKNIVTFSNPYTGIGNVQGVFWGANALASTYSTIMQSAKDIGSGAVLDDVAKAAGTAGTIANLVNAASAINDAVACRNAE